MSEEKLNLLLKELTWYMPPGVYVFSVEKPRKVKVERRQSAEGSDTTTFRYRDSCVEYDDPSRLPPELETEIEKYAQGSLYLYRDFVRREVNRVTSRIREGTRPGEYIYRRVDGGRVALWPNFTPCITENDEVIIRFEEYVTDMGLVSKAEPGRVATRRVASSDDIAQMSLEFQAAFLREVGQYKEFTGIPGNLPDPEEIHNIDDTYTLP